MSRLLRVLHVPLKTFVHHGGDVVVYREVRTPWRTYTFVVAAIAGAFRSEADFDRLAAIIEGEL